MQASFIALSLSRQKTKPILSGTMDVIVCIQNDGKLKSTKFSIRIGKLELYKPNQEDIVSLQNFEMDGKIILEPRVFIKVSLRINEEKFHQQMYLDTENGIAYFKFENENKIILTEQPTDDILQQMNLKLGLNNLVYSFQDQNQINTISCRIFKVTSYHKIIISDIDGTVTKSDLMGHFMASLKINWSHDDICRLFDKFVTKGYFIVYLSARSVVQYSNTLELLQRIQQDGINLPEGPILLNEQTLFDAFKTEVIYKTSQIVKIKLLKIIASVFDQENGNCFKAGFGNRANDAIAYRDMGLPFSNIYLINKKSVIYQLDQKITISYKILHDKFDEYFKLQME